MAPSPSSCRPWSLATWPSPPREPKEAARKTPKRRREAVPASPSSPALRNLLRFAREGRPAKPRRSAFFPPDSGRAASAADVPDYYMADSEPHGQGGGTTPARAPSRKRLRRASPHAKELGAPPRAERPERVSRDDLRSARFVGFFAGFPLFKVGGRYLCADPHAADERLRLEALEGPLAPRLGTVKREATVPLSDDEMEALAAHGSTVRRWGFAFRVARSAAELSAVPVVCGHEATADDLRAWLRHLGSLAAAGIHGPAPRMAAPPFAMAALRRKACRSAIFLNDAVTPSGAESLLQRLAACRLPFNCAHGRPTVLPLLGVER